MNATSVAELDVLRRQIAATHARFAAIAARLGRAAEAIATNGTLPPESLLREVQDAAQEFQAVRTAVLDAAASLEVVPATPLRAARSLRELAPLMDAVVVAAEQAVRRRRLDAARAACCAVLNRVSAVAHRDDPTFRPVAACQDKARALRATIAGVADAGDVDVEIRAWACAVAPFAALMDLIEAAEVAADADDAPPSALEDAVASVFGRPLAAAAAHGLLLVR